MSKRALAALSKVIDPELRRPITELGMVGKLTETNSAITAEIKLTIVGCPAAQSIERDVNEALAAVFDQVEVQMTTMSASERDELKQKLRGDRPIRHNPFAQEGSLTKVLFV
ncbi:MAG: iron-sulfur cluster assembly protein, partial [Aquiluna sp.]